ncbi:MAG: glycoside hydrolase family 26 protein, partial [Myxococcaceae bacterium]
NRGSQLWWRMGVLALVLGCGPGMGRGPVNPGGPDGGGVNLDAGPTPGLDGGPIPDAGADGGVSPDAGAGGDGGTDGGNATGQRIQLPPAGRLYHGVFPAGTTLPDSDVSMEAADAYRDAVGRPLAYVYFSNEWYRTKAFPQVTAEAIRARGAVPFIRLHMRSQQQQLVPDPTYTLDRINAGEFDGDLRAWADGAKAFGTALVVQYGTEVNGDWNPWSAEYNGGLAVGPAKFKQAYRHIVQVMRAEGATNITWALHINGENWPGDDPRNNAGAYYPGDDVVDWIGFSLYQNYGAGDPLCRDVDALLEAREAELGAAARSKPLFVFELGTSMTSTQCDPGGWVRQTLTDLLDGRWEELHGFAWWDETTADGSIVMRVPDTPALQQPFHDVLNGPLGSNLQDRPVVK